VGSLAGRAEDFKRFTGEKGARGDQRKKGAKGSLRGEFCFPAQTIRSKREFYPGEREKRGGGKEEGEGFSEQGKSTGGLRGKLLRPPSGNSEMGSANRSGTGEDMGREKFRGLGEVGSRQGFRKKYRSIGNSKKHGEVQEQKPLQARRSQ